MNRIKEKLYSQLETLYNEIQGYIDESDKIIEKKVFENLPLDEALKEVFSYRDYVYTTYDLLNGENIEMFDIELPDMDLRGYDLRNLHLTNYVPGTFDENWRFTPSTVNLEGTGCTVNLNTAQYVLGEDGKTRTVDLRGFNLQGCNLYGRITENLGEGCYKRIIPGGSTQPLDGKEIDVLVGENTLTDAYTRRMNRTTPLRVNERYIYERILKKGPTMPLMTRKAKLNDMDLSEASLSEQLTKIKQLANNDADISFTGAFIPTAGTQSLGRENYYLDLNAGLIEAIKNNEEPIVIEELIAAGADPAKSFMFLKEENNIIKWTTPAGVAIENKEKVNGYLDVLLKNGLTPHDAILFDTAANMKIVSSSTLLDYKVARDYFWDRIDKYPELVEELVKYDKQYGTSREVIPGGPGNKTNRQEIEEFLKDTLELTDDEIAGIDKKDPEFFDKRTVKDDLEVKLKILEANGLGKTVLLKTPKHFNQTPETMFARTKFFSKEKVRITDKNYHKTLFMPKTKFADSYGRRILKRDTTYSDRVYTEEVDKKIKKKYRLPDTMEKLSHEVKTISRCLGDE